MAGEEEKIGFRIWAVDNNVYGPVELPTLIGWIKDERVTAHTWVYVESEDAWRKASEVMELKMFFRAKPLPGRAAPAPTHSGEMTIAGLKPGTLRRIKIFGDMSDGQLDRFIQYMEIQQVRQFAEVVHQGDHGDTMYLVLEGEVRVRLMISGKESTLTTLNAGEFFGEISLFDQGPRSADVVANKDSVLLKVSTEAFKRLVAEAPELATPLLMAISKTLTSRIRADNKRFRDSINFARTASGQGS